MSYLALYRQFRPKTFEEIIGQDHVVKTLINQINTGRVGHAYLFCGARGTGKTTAAKVFARAINCVNPKNGSPCGECEVCKKLESPANLDVLEMDAASNNKVENVRDIRDKVQYPPVAGKYKVYIIDEVHMLTTEAFNALLKTLEEPPSHAVFILATTEVHKIPATILSRCLRFDFKLISTAQIAQFICEIYDKVGKKYQKEAVTLIAKAGEGSVRDALSIADICLSYSKNELTYDDVLEVLGTSDRAVIEKLIGAMFQGQTGEMLSLSDELLMRGKSVSILNRDVASALRDILVIKTCKNASEILSIPQDKLKELQALSDKTSVHGLLRAIEIFSASEADLKYSTHPKIVFETAAVKVSLPETDYNIDALMARISALEKKIAEGNFTVSGGAGVAPSANLSGEVAKPVVKEVATASVKEEKPIEKQTSTINVMNNPPKIEEVKPIKEEPAPEKQEKQEQAKAQKQADSAPAMDEDLASLIASAEQFGYGDEEPQFNFFGEPTAKKPANRSINGTKAQETSVKPTAEEPKKPAKEEKSAISPSSAISTAPSGGIDKNWGAILRLLRQKKEIMLWVACQDVTASEENGFVIILAPGENEYSLLSKPDNVAKLSTYVAEYGYLGAKVVKDMGEELKKQQEDLEAEQVKDYVGEKLVVKD